MECHQRRWKGHASGNWIRSAFWWPTPYNKKVAAFAHVVRFGERGTEAAPATSERYLKLASRELYAGRGKVLVPLQGMW